MESERPIEELFVEEYFGLGDAYEKMRIDTDYGQVVNLVTMFKEKYMMKTADAAFVADRGKTSSAQFKKDHGIERSVKSDVDMDRFYALEQEHGFGNIGSCRNHGGSCDCAGLCRFEESKRLRDSVFAEAELAQTLRKRSETLELLNSFCNFLEDQGYIDTDWRAEQPHAIDKFLMEKMKK